jgi:hypothetical protein
MGQQLPVLRFGTGKLWQTDWYVGQQFPVSCQVRNGNLTDKWGKSYQYEFLNKNYFQFFEENKMLWLISLTFKSFKKGNFRDI